MFPNIPLEQVKATIEKRWDHIKEHTNISYKKFNEATNFVLHSTYFQLNGEFYEQKIDTPIGFVLLPI